MHTANPRVLAEVRGGVPTGVTFEWLLHWGEPWMDDQMHMSIHQVGKRVILNTGLTYLVRALDDAAITLLTEVSTDARRRASIERVEAELTTQPLVAVNSRAVCRQLGDYRPRARIA